MIDVNREGEVWVFAEQHNGQLEDTPIELMSKARHLADTLGVKLAAVLLGDGGKGLATNLTQCGADKVYIAEHPLLQAYQANSYARVMYDLIHKHEPQIVLYGATTIGRSLAPTVAVMVDAGLTAGCTEPDYDVVAGNLLAGAMSWSLYGNLRTSLESQHSRTLHGKCRKQALLKLAPQY